MNTAVNQDRWGLGDESLCLGEEGDSRCFNSCSGGWRLYWEEGVREEGFGTTSVLVWILYEVLHSSTWSPPPL